MTSGVFLSLVNIRNLVEQIRSKIWRGRASGFPSSLTRVRRGCAGPPRGPTSYELWRDEVVDSTSSATALEGILATAS